MSWARTGSERKHTRCTRRTSLSEKLVSIISVGRAALAVRERRPAGALAQARPELAQRMRMQRTFGAADVDAKRRRAAIRVRAMVDNVYQR